MGLGTKLKLKFHYKDRGAVLRLVSYFVIFVNYVIASLLVISFFVYDNSHVIDRLLFAIGLLLYNLLTLVLINKSMLLVGSIMLLGAFYSVATIISLQWGINTPVALILYGFVIFLAAISLGSQSVPLATILVVMSLLLVQYLTYNLIIDPDYSSLGSEPSYIDALTYTVIFILFSAVGWLSSSLVEKAAREANAARTMLENQNKSLAKIIKSQTEQLRESYVNELNQIYQFAELGQLTTMHTHSLSNQLTNLRMSIEDLAQDKKHATLKDDLIQFEETINKINRQIKPPKWQVFNSAEVLNEIVYDLTTKYQAKKLPVSFHLNIQNDQEIYGDTERFKQLMIIAITNAIEAYEMKKKRRVDITLITNEDTQRVTIRDYAKSLSQDEKKALLSRAETTKTNGHGIGLFISGKIMQYHFNGRLHVDLKSQQTTLIYTFPYATSKQKTAPPTASPAPAKA